MPSLGALLQSFTPIGVEALNRCQLLRRVDRKFMMPATQLPDFLAAVRDHYGVLVVSDRRRARYRTDYFDTPTLDFFHAHRRGRRPRHKVRLRHYIDRSLTYLEVKTRTNRNVTEKKRWEAPFCEPTLSACDRDAAAALHHMPGTLVRSASTSYERITLVSLEHPERLTIDTHLELRHGMLSHALAQTVVLEVKLPPNAHHSVSLAALRPLGLHPQSMSKYCTALLLSLPELPRASFRRTLRVIKELES